METLNEAEEFVYRICSRSFLSLWSYANPRGKEPGKELCDILVVCEPDIILFSVKEIRMTDSGDPAVDRQRWRKRAIEDSCRQIYGAERFLKTASHVIRKDGSQGLPLPKETPWRVHRVAVAIEHEDKAPIEFGDFGKGFVHVFDKTSCGIILGELDTISDFVGYLAAKEALYAEGVATLFHGAEEDLLALYLHRGRVFPEGPDMLVLSDGLWESVRGRPEYRARKAEDRKSYVWDRLIEGLLAGYSAAVEPGPTFTEQDLAVRTMARESRFSRRVLGKALVEYLALAKRGKCRSRGVPSLSGVVYVFLRPRAGEESRDIQAELGIRCFVVRGMHRECRTVIGVALQEGAAGLGSSSSLLYLDKPSWTDEDQAAMTSIQAELGYSSNPVTRRVREDEYPAPQPRLQHARGRIGRNAPCPCGSGRKHKNCHGR